MPPVEAVGMAVSCVGVGEDAGISIYISDAKFSITFTASAAVSDARMAQSASVTTFLSTLRRRGQLTLYALAGLVGALSGVLVVLISVVAVRSTLDSSDSSLASVVLTAICTGAVAGPIGVALSITMYWFQRQRIRWAQVLWAGVGGFASGAASAGLFQALYNGVTEEHRDVSLVVIVAAAILTGGMLGALLSRNAPNVSPMRGLITGLLSGAAVGLSSTAAFASKISSPGFFIIGAVVFGPIFGLALAIAERYFRSATVEVEWEPSVTSRVGLGPQPVSIGGGRDDVFIKGAPAHISTIVINNGQIEHVETANGKRTKLTDGSRLRINGLTMVVHATRRGK